MLDPRTKSSSRGRTCVVWTVNGRTYVERCDGNLYPVRADGGHPLDYGASGRSGTLTDSACPKRSS